MSPRQLEVLELLARGLKPAVIARRLYMTEETVRTHRRRAIEAFAKDERTRLADNSELVYRSMVEAHRPGPGPGTGRPGASNPDDAGDPAPTPIELRSESASPLVRRAVPRCARLVAHGRLAGPLRIIRHPLSLGVTALFAASATAWAYRGVCRIGPVMPGPPWRWP